MEERLQKILSSAGVCSRRGAEELILSGRVAVNGRTAQLGEKADPKRDEIEVDGHSIYPKEQKTYLMLHKPTGYVTTLSDERNRPTVADLVKNCPVRVWPVGRLDQDSEGLLFLSNDGDLTFRLTHPSHQWEKEYHVTVSGDAEAALPILSGPMKLDGVPLAPAKVRVIGREGRHPILSVVIHEGKNRQVRRMCAQAGLEVLRLIRVREGQIVLGNLKKGQWRPLTREELRLLQVQNLPMQEKT